MYNSSCFPLEQRGSTSGMASQHQAETSEACPDTTLEFRVLVFSRTGGYRHASIPAGISALKDLARRSRFSTTPFSVHDTEDATAFDPSTLATYRVIVFLQSSGEFLDNETQLSALASFVHGGGGVVGIHCASAGLPSSDYYARLIGAVFTDHPEPQNGIVDIEDPGHPIMCRFAASIDTTTAATTTTDVAPGRAPPAQFEWYDEWYNFESNPRTCASVHVLMSVRETSYRGGCLGEDHPIAWCQEFDNGARSFYTALGHFDEAYANTLFTDHILSGILWVAKR